ncbi:DEAD/DEAH box helicase, putative [Plasmodium gallinaceum]|uniref:DEAD/DEAH box helicase, putative n=1 Tax=Plasmodium gallinaceum TaxID=5849 RepID=A0A1J1GTS0_PLAGA|nr:DEAD/DEAH box helicase, putative [Plasmodium gallinaceum]CRG95882.1 DEAD/DEAH box helicase, putative [Plasmodium gallinaceum]
MENVEEKNKKMLNSKKDIYEIDVSSNNKSLNENLYEHKDNSVKKFYPNCIQLNENYKKCENEIYNEAEMEKVDEKKDKQKLDENVFHNYTTLNYKNEEKEKISSERNNKDDKLENKKKNNETKETLEELLGELKSYQLEEFQFLINLYNNRLNGILAYEMGLGKIFQTIILLANLKESNLPILLIFKT